jgi:hypothetical protein
LAKEKNALDGTKRTHSYTHAGARGERKGKERTHSCQTLEAEHEELIAD